MLTSMCTNVELIGNLYIGSNQENWGLQLVGAYLIKLLLLKLEESIRFGCIFSLYQWTCLINKRLIHLDIGRLQSLENYFSFLGFLRNKITLQEIT